MPIEVVIEKVRILEVGEGSGQDLGEIQLAAALYQDPMNFHRSVHAANRGGSMKLDAGELCIMTGFRHLSRFVHGPDVPHHLLCMPGTTTRILEIGLRKNSITMATTTRCLREYAMTSAPSFPSEVRLNSRTIFRLPIG